MGGACGLAGLCLVHVLGGPKNVMPLRFAHAGDFPLDEDRYFADTAQCLQWFVADAIRASVDLFVINGDLTTYKATIKERNLWVDRLVEMANHAPVIGRRKSWGRA